MGKFIDPFTVNLPVIDLHGETRDSAAFLIKKLNYFNITIVCPILKSK